MAARGASAIACRPQPSRGYQVDGLPRASSFIRCIEFDEDDLTCWVGNVIQYIISVGWGITPLLQGFYGYCGPHLGFLRAKVYRTLPLRFLGSLGPHFRVTRSQSILALTLGFYGSLGPHFRVTTGQSILALTLGFFKVPSGHTLGLPRVTVYSSFL